MLPIEIQGLIILELGIPLLCQISKSLRKLYHMDIIKYYATLPITPNEIKNYIKDKPTSIKCFKINNGLNVKTYFFLDDNYHLCSNILMDDSIHYLPTKANDKDDVLIITDNEVKNYDLYTTYMCLKTRHSIYIKKILYDTFNYYCSLLSGPALSLYLYTNIQMLKSYFWVSQNDLLSINKHEQLKLEIIDLINKLPYEDTPLNINLIMYPV